MGRKGDLPIAGGIGNDTITAGTKGLIAAGGDGDDVITGSTDRDIIWGDGWNTLSLGQYAKDQGANIHGTHAPSIYSGYFTNGSGNG